MSKRLTKKELRRINLRHRFGLQLGHNYERMQGMGYFYAILPALKNFMGMIPKLWTEPVGLIFNFTTPLRRCLKSSLA